MADVAENGDYEVALKQVFLKTDEDLRADPSFFNDPSGCTAVVGIITDDGRIIVVSFFVTASNSELADGRQMLVTLVLS